MKKFYKVFSFILILSIIFTSGVFALRGKRVLATDKYIWVYVDGERKLLTENAGYPCFGQGIDNKNILYMPLNVIAELAGYAVSPLKKMDAENGEKIVYVTVSNGPNTFDVVIGSKEFGGQNMADYSFILKGTETSGNPVVMVPLGVAKDYFGLGLEVKRPVGRGVYDYCSLGINFTGCKPLNTTGPMWLVSIIRETDKKEELQDIYDFAGTGLLGYTTFYVSTGDSCFHKETCSQLSKNYASLNYLECRFWGFEQCPFCIDEDEVFYILEDGTTN